MIQSDEKKGDQSAVNLKEDRVRGVLWGAVLGDVIGAFLEFNRGIDEAKIKQAFLIKGGGMHKLEPGQPTDDSELAYAVGKGLVKGKGLMDLNKICQQMGNWFLSKPIDVGTTIRKSVPKACNMKEHQAYLCRKGAAECSQNSQSNGTLMAIAPLSIWCMNLSPPQIFQAVWEYTILIHPNQLVTLCNTLYTYILTYLVRRSEVGDEEQKISAFRYGKQKIYECCLPHCKKQNSDQFRQWISLIQSSFENPKLLFEKVCATKKAGWCRVALFMFLQLVNPSKKVYNLSSISKEILILMLAQLEG